MKKINKNILLILITLVFIVSSVIITLYANTETNYDHVKRWVYVCFDEDDHVYHKESCWVLSKCKSKVLRIPESEAIDMDRMPCGVCYQKMYHDPQKPGYPAPDDFTDDKDKDKDKDSNIDDAE